MIEAEAWAPLARAPLFLASLALVALLLAADVATGEQTVLAAAYALAPLLAALRCRPREVGTVGAGATAAVLASAALLDYLDPGLAQFWVRLLSVAAMSALAVAFARLVRRSEALAARQRFLNETGEALAGADDDVGDALARVVRVAVPAMADWCAIDLVGPEGGLERVGVAHADPEKAALAEELRRRWPASLDDADGAGATIRTGEAQTFSDIPHPSAWPEGTRHPEHQAVLAGLGMRSGMILPLRARERTLGAITLISAESGRRYGPDDVALAGELARRCALTLESVRARAEARAAREQLEESYAIVEALFESAPVGLAHLDGELRYLRVNDRMAQVNQAPAGAHLGRTPAEVLPAGFADPTPELRRVLETGRPVTDDAISRPSGEFLASYYPVRRGDEVLGVGAIVFDVTDRRGADRALRAQTDRYETLMLALSEVGEGMVVLEGDALVYANSAFEELTGHPLDELRTMDSIWDLIPDWNRTEVRERAALRAEQGIVDPHYEFVVTHRSGRLVDLDVAAVPLRIDERDQLVVVVRDITARKRAEAEREDALAMERRARETAEAAERRMAFLAGASALFDESLDEHETLERVARLTVAEVADTCVIVLGEAEGFGSAHQAIAVARDPGREALMAELEPRWPADVSPDAMYAAAMRAGEPRLLRRFGTALEAMALDPGHLAQVRQLGLAAAAVVPLRARGRTFGAMAVGFADPPSPDHERETLALLEDLGRRAALAIDNARLYAERSHVARTLQRSLLPADLPAIPGVELAARYRPAGAGNEVGGDFYDSFATSGSDYALAIGDVCGKGPEAASVTALARYTMRASVLHSGDPVRVLSELNEAILRQGLDFRFCTVLYAALSPGAAGWNARLASGGHPLPLVLRADGRVEQAGAAGTLLGIVPDPELTSTDVALGPGDTLVLYTDGVIEASPVQGDFDTEALAALLAGQAGRDAASVVGAVEEAVLAVQGGRLRDDVAVVALRVASAP